MEKGKSVAGSVQFSALSTTTTTHTVEVLGFPTRPSSIYFLLLVNINNDETKSTANKWQIRFCFCFYSPAQQKPSRTPNAPFLGKTKTKQKTCRLTGNPPLCERKSATYLLLPGMDAIHVGWFALDWFGPRRGGTLEHQELASQRTYATYSFSESKYTFYYVKALFTQNIAPFTT